MVVDVMDNEEGEAMLPTKSASTLFAAYARAPKSEPGGTGSSFSFSLSPPLSGRARRVTYKSAPCKRACLFRSATVWPAYRKECVLSRWRECFATHFPGVQICLSF